MIKIKCPNCGGNNISKLKKCDECFLLRCDECRLVMKSIKDLNRKKTQELQDSVYHDVGRIQNKMNHKMASDRLNILARFKKDGKLLEIGCATGEFLEAANNFGFDVLGIDASKIYSSYAIEKGLNVKFGRLEDIDVKAPKFDIIVFFHLIEHIENPQNFLEKAFSYMAPNGLLFVITPNIESLTNKLFGYKHPDFEQSDHLFFFSKTTLKDFLQRAGFYIELISSKEYRHHPFTSLIGVTSYILKIKTSHIVTQCYENENIGNFSKLSTKYGKRHVLRLFMKFVINKLPYFIGDFLYPILKPYGILVERFVKGHELIIIARKP